MINLLNMLEFSQVAFVGILFAFAFTCMAIAKFNPYLPKDMGRQFAHDGKLSAGKPRGAGIIFIFTFAISALLFAQMNVEIAIYLILIVVEMLTGYFDDAAEKPWGEYLKGFLDLAVAVVVVHAVPGRAAMKHTVLQKENVSGNGSKFLVVGMDGKASFDDTDQFPFLVPVEGHVVLGMGRINVIIGSREL